MQVRKLKKKIKKIINPRNIVILVCIILILGFLYFMFGQTGTRTPSGIKVVETNIQKDSEMTEEKARKSAVKQFKILGEKNVKEDKLSVKKILRNEEEYYYISSAENTIEIQVRGGKITRINSATVEE